VDKQEETTPEKEALAPKKGIWSGIKGLAKKFWGFLENLIFI
jgi:hypothetical protein